MSYGVNDQDENLLDSLDSMNMGVEGNAEAAREAAIEAEKRRSREKWKEVRKLTAEDLNTATPEGALGFLIDNFAEGTHSKRNVNEGYGTEKDVKSVDGASYSKIFARVAEGVNSDIRMLREKGDNEKADKIMKDATESTFVKRMQHLVNVAQESDYVTLHTPDNQVLTDSMTVKAIESALSSIHDGVTAEGVARRKIINQTDQKRSRMDAQQLLDDLAKQEKAKTGYA